MQKETKGEQKNTPNILKVTKSDQYHTAGELLEESQPNSIYYTLLILSSFIVACGLLLDNPSIVIGGMLVTPMLTPVLAVALCISAGEPKPLQRLGILLGKSFLIVVVAAVLMTLVFGLPHSVLILENSLRTAILYFVVAIVSGVAATFAWVRKEIAAVLPGIAIAVSLVPPIAAVGIWLSALQFETARFYFLVFLFNLFGIVMGSVVVFSLLRFYRADKKIQQAQKAADDAEKK